MWLCVWRVIDCVMLFGMSVYGYWWWLSIVYGFPRVVCAWLCDVVWDVVVCLCVVCACACVYMCGLCAAVCAIMFGRFLLFVCVCVCIRLCWCVCL